MKRHHRLPQNLHLLPKGARKRRSCGVLEGGFIRATDRAYIAKFLKAGGGICLACRQVEGV